jgi:hypothetical protein
MCIVFSESGFSSMALIAAALSHICSFRRNSMNEKESGDNRFMKDLWTLAALFVGVIVVAALMMKAIEKFL